MFSHTIAPQRVALMLRLLIQAVEQTPVFLDALTLLRRHCNDNQWYGAWKIHQNIDILSGI